MKKITALVIIALAFLPLALYAQGGPTDVSDTPVDGGLTLLLAAGIGYGAKKLYKKKNQKNTEK